MTRGQPGPPEDAAGTREGGEAGGAGAGRAAPETFTVLLPSYADFAAWRAAARKLLAAAIPPEAVEWRTPEDPPGLFTGPPPPDAVGPPLAVPRDFVEMAELAVRHADRERFALLHSLLWDARARPGLLRTPTEPRMARLGAMARAVRRDAHKMHAFLRFREIDTAEGPRSVAWFEPEHHIVEAEAGFFVRRFAILRWSILTPRRCAHWDGAALAFTLGARRADAPAEDAAEDLWRTYFASIFNPARLKPDAMRAEMPKKYWRNLPEAEVIPELMKGAEGRVRAMLGQQPKAPGRRQKPGAK
ncbi:TIGR03915 family putative DNA repair protein [Teichococcus rhizosphaerae]|uniref:TIGR03915 family putative DNA repair protein n=1 Tax=Teichococcus rhizosphaerae TaxID=1335062 RepID=UPI001FEA0B0C|nr:TIGR03915 family putative DNA repair protein [Pseudoroseomonas rhizosphaerae]